MKLATFASSAGGARVGAVVDGDRLILDLQSAHEAAAAGPAPVFASMQALMDGGEAALDEARRLVARRPVAATPLREVRLLSPLPVPAQIRDCLCFEKHLLQAFKMARKVRAMKEPDPEAAERDMEAKGLYRVPDVWYQQPIYYKANRFAVIGDGEDVIWPDYANLLDFELEFGLFVGKRGKDIAKEQARDYVFGYSIFNDVSARDTQMVEMQGQLGPAKGKDFDTANVIGPWIVTADELTDPYRLTMIARVNGEEWGRGSSSEMHWRFEDLIAHISRCETLHPGEFIGSGTVGNGAGVETMRFLKPGDVVELEVEGIGVLKNRVVRPNVVRA